MTKDEFSKKSSDVPFVRAQVVDSSTQTEGRTFIFTNCRSAQTAPAARTVFTRSSRYTSENPVVDSREDDNQSVIFPNRLTQRGDSTYIGSRLAAKSATRTRGRGRARRNRANLGPDNDNIARQYLDDLAALLDIPDLAAAKADAPPKFGLVPLPPLPPPLVRRPPLLPSNPHMNPFTARTAAMAPKGVTLKHNMTPLGKALHPLKVSAAPPAKTNDQAVVSPIGPALNDETPITIEAPFGKFTVLPHLPILSQIIPILRSSTQSTDWIATALASFATLNSREPIVASARALNAPRTSSKVAACVQTPSDSTKGSGMPLAAIDLSGRPLISRHPVEENRSLVKQAWAVLAETRAPLVQSSTGTGPREAVLSKDPRHRGTSCSSAAQPRATIPKTVANSLSLKAGPVAPSPMAPETRLTPQIAATRLLGNPSVSPSLSRVRPLTADHDDTGNTLPSDPAHTTKSFPPNIAKRE